MDLQAKSKDNQGVGNFHKVCPVEPEPSGNIHQTLVGFPDKKRGGGPLK